MSDHRMEEFVPDQNESQDQTMRDQRRIVWVRVAEQ